MSEWLAVFLLMNNYFHDVATAMLLACGIVLWAIMKAQDSAAGSGASAYASAMRRSVMRLVRFSVAWIVASGVIRIATVEEFEWKNFTDKGLESGLIAKYVIAVVMMFVGAYVLAKQAGRRKKTTTAR
jgi:uncharacterized membrane protein